MDNTQLPTADSGVTGEDALAVLHTDHQLIQAGAAADAEVRASDRHAFVARLGAMLNMHARIEDEIFYPALLTHGGVQVQEAMADHADIATLLEALAGTDPLSKDFDNRMDFLIQAVQLHIEQEERLLFPAAAGVDLAALGKQLALRRAALMGDMAVD
jgi:iron-sulfur cluster repair protein YtfE (RIC family)